MKNKLIRMANEAGFPAVAFASLSPVRQTGRLHPQAETLTADPAACMDGARCVMLMASPYRPFRTGGTDAQVDAYYLTSNASHEATALLARRIEETLSIRALATPPVYIKPLAVRSGLGEFGRNGLISVPPYGTRVSIHAILLSAEIETHDRTERTFSPSCEHCGACVSACPVQALDGTGRVDVSRCLRAQPDGEVFPEELRAHLGAGILGCDLCQRACPRNAGIQEIDPPEDLSRALNLSDLLQGEYQPLIPFLGKNNARRQRLTARALIAAANLNRRDLLPLIEPLTECRESEIVREHAKWAREQLLKICPSGSPQGQN